MLSREHRKILKVFIDTEISGISTYWGYKGDAILRLRTKHSQLAESIQGYCESQNIDVAMTLNRNLGVYEVFCISADDDVYELKT